MNVFELLKRASDKLEDYCAEVNGDMNDSLATEIDAFVKTGGWRTDFENIPNADFMFDSNIYKAYSVRVLVTVKGSPNYVKQAYFWQWADDDETIEDTRTWVLDGPDAYSLESSDVLAYQLLPEPLYG
jgi:hypothetical protein